MRRTLSLIALTCIGSTVAFSYFKEAPEPRSLSEAAGAFVQSLDEKQQQSAVMPLDTPQRVNWHFIPKDERKGLQLKHMDDAQRAAAHVLLRSALSAAGYTKATSIMHLEALLHELEGGKGQNIRDPERYYFTLFGDVGADSRWGLSVEGHHLSLNFVIDHDEMVSSTPQVFCTNPAVIKNENKTGIPVGTRILKQEEVLAFELVNSLTEDQQKQGILADKAPREIRAAGEAQPPTAPAEGIRYADLNGEQRGLLLQLIQEYCNAMPEDVAKQRMDKIHFDGLNTVHFAWMGATKPGIGHYYKVQGPSFLIEFVNTQPDAAGNPANHIHCIFRDMHGDFGLPIDG